jgi:hypothetical protein
LRPLSNNEEGFYINKTYIFKRDGEYFLNYKTDEAPIEEETFLEFCRLAKSYQENKLTAIALDKFADKYGDRDFPKKEFQSFLDEFRANSLP